MSKMTVRASYALDEPTAARIRRLAARWRVSQAEVIRRAVREAADAELPAPLTPAEVVARYRSGALPRAAKAAKGWAADNTRIRHASDAARSAGGGR